jgi:4-diphosphocytidyl-2C-methyl-D-erythritol kinase
VDSIFKQEPGSFRIAASLQQMRNIVSALSVSDLPGFLTKGTALGASIGSNLFDCPVEEDWELTNPWTGVAVVCGKATAYAQMKSERADQIVPSGKRQGANALPPNGCSLTTATRDKRVRFPSINSI